MRRIRSQVWVLALALPALAGQAGCSSAAPPKVRAASGSQLAFGVTMAQRGLWNEALFRFEQARAVNPDSPQVLNNLAVAYEAVGRYEDALAAYKDALRAAPANREVKLNYARFVEFYQGFKGRSATPPARPAAETLPSGTS